MMILPGFQEHPGDPNRGPMPCSTGTSHVLGKRSAYQECLLAVVLAEQQVLSNHAMLCGGISNIQTLLTQPLSEHWE